MMYAYNTEEVIESDEYGEAVFDAEVIYPEVDNLFIFKTEHVYTQCTSEGWANQQVSDGGPRSL